MLIVNRLVHAVHASGNTVVRNLIEGRPRHVLASLDRLAAAVISPQIRQSGGAGQRWAP